MTKSTLTTREDQIIFSNACIKEVIIQLNSSVTLFFSNAGYDLKFIFPQMNEAILFLHKAITYSYINHREATIFSLKRSIEILYELLAKIEDILNELCYYFKAFIKNEITIINIILSNEILKNIEVDQK